MVWTHAIEGGVLTIKHSNGHSMSLSGDSDETYQRIINEHPVFGEPVIIEGKACVLVFDYGGVTLEVFCKLFSYQVSFGMTAIIQSRAVEFISDPDKFHSHIARVFDTAFRSVTPVSVIGGITIPIIYQSDSVNSELYFVRYEKRIDMLDFYDEIASCILSD